MAENEATPEKSVEDQAREQTGQQRVQLRIDESGMDTCYANVVRTHAGNDELMMDFGLNLVTPPAQEGADPQILFKVSQRVVMNYYAAKRLAITLSQIIRRHEEQFGELELDVQKRRKDS